MIFVDEIEEKMSFMKELIRYKVGYEISWAVLRRVQGQAVNLSEEIYVPVEIVPTWRESVYVNSLLIEEVVRMDDGRKAFLLRPDHRKVTALAESLLREPGTEHAVRQWFATLSPSQLQELQEGYAFYQAHSQD